MDYKSLLNQNWRIPVAIRSSYLEKCEQAVQDETIFKSFRRLPEFIDMFESVTAHAGHEIFEIIRSRYTFLIPSLALFAESDQIGDPLKIDCDGVLISPATLRYVKILGDLISIYGDLTKFSIYEIGGGYGGQCRIIQAYCGFRNYHIVDLKEALLLQSKFLEKMKVSDVELIESHQLQPSACDLVISNYAFSEFSIPEQNRYFEALIKDAPRGYFTLNNTVTEIFNSRIARTEPEEPPTAPSNRIVIWGTYSTQRSDTRA